MNRGANVALSTGAALENSGENANAIRTSIESSFFIKNVDANMVLHSMIARAAVESIFPRRLQINVFFSPFRPSDVNNKRTLLRRLTLHPHVPTCPRKLWL